MSSVANQRTAFVKKKNPSRFILKHDRNTIHVFYFLNISRHNRTWLHVKRTTYQWQNTLFKTLNYLQHNFKCCWAITTKKVVIFSTTIKKSTLITKVMMTMLSWCCCCVLHLCFSFLAGLYCIYLYADDNWLPGSASPHGYSWKLLL